MPELFSIIVLIYNNSEFVEECINSILIQDYSNIEIIVVDDGSKSFNQAVIENYINNNKKKNIHHFTVYQNEHNLGTVKSANGALKKAGGSFIKLLAADDALYDSHTLSSAAEALRQSPCGVITGDVMRCDENLKPISKYRNTLPQSLNNLEPIEVFKRLCVHNDIVAGGVFFSSSFFNKYGFFDESYRLLEDWPTWLTATKQGCRFLYSPFYAIRYRSNGGVGTSINPLYMADKKRVFAGIIKPSKKIIGLGWYAKARMSFMAINSSLVRKVYGIVFRKGK